MESLGYFEAHDTRTVEANPAPEQAIEFANNFSAVSPSGKGTKAEHLIPRWKRTLDLCCIIMSAPIWMPIMICVAVWIRIVSPGPVFYRQQRVGMRGRRFMMLKFRSMKVNVATQSHENHFDHLVDADLPMTKLDAAGDTRLINGGWLLRATGLDELPQLFNVLLGEMSLVGPRPCTPHELHKYQQWQTERFQAAPGLTGYWQVNGKNNTTFSKMIELDIFYARNMSFFLDVGIVLKTPAALIAQVAGN